MTRQDATDDPQEELQGDPEMDRALEALLDDLSRGELQPRLRPGTLLPGSEYLVEQYLGSGTFGDVYAVVHRSQGWEAAVKILKYKWVHHPRVRAAFTREANTMRSIAHERFVKVEDYHEPDGAAPFFRMELLRGEDLRARLEREPLSPGQLRALSWQLLDGLAALHDQGVLHRDLKPSNVFLCEGPALSIKILDLGLALPADAPRSSIVGTPQYSAPEQTEGHETHRSDLFSVAAILYDAIYQRPSVATRPWVPQELHAVLRRAMDRDPARRPRSARRLQVALDRGFERWARGSRRSRPVLMAAGGIAVLALGWWLLRGVMASPCAGPSRPGARCIPAGRIEREPIDVEVLVRRCVELSVTAPAEAERSCRRRIERERQRPKIHEIPEPLWLDRHEVTWAELVAWLRTRRVALDGEALIDEQTRRPMVVMNPALAWDGARARLAIPDGRRAASFVTWFGARAYCRDHGRRLPTEVEWEHAARRSWNGGASPGIPECGDVVAGRSSPAWRTECPGDPSVVDATRPHGWDRAGELLHLHGNVAEWVDTLYEDEGEVFALVKGGSVQQPLVFARPAARARLPRLDGPPDVGFRCAADARASH